LFLEGKSNVEVRKAACMEDNDRRKEVARVVQIVQKCLYSFLYMYAGCSGNNHICTWVVMGTIAYVRDF
jgi:hypothetical protein